MSGPAKVRYNGVTCSVLQCIVDWFFAVLPKQEQLPKREALTDCLDMLTIPTLGLKTAFLEGKQIVSLNVDLVVIARQSIEASRLGN